MRKKAEEDDVNTLYYYLHTKGLRHFGNSNEQCIIDWINLMVYWNIEKWELAIKKLEQYDTYGCNYTIIPKNHFSGNFWWSKANHILKLPLIISDNYNSPEFWIQEVENNSFSAYNSEYTVSRNESEGHYANLYPRNKYSEK